MGAIGPLVSPVAPFLNPFLGVLGDVVNGTSPDMTAALSGLINAPFKAVNGFFNGSALDVGLLLPVLNQLGVLPDEVLGVSATYDGLNFAFGGLLTPGDVGAADAGGPS